MLGLPLQFITETHGLFVTESKRQGPCVLIAMLSLSMKVFIQAKNIEHQ